MPDRFASGRHAGIIVPLFSVPSRASWGIGEIADLPRLARWLDACALDIVQLLPVNEMADGQNSPYSAMSAMATDPIYIALSNVPEFIEAGGESSLTADEQHDLDEARHAPLVEYSAIRALKSRALRAAFEAFDYQGGHETARGAAFRAFADAEAWWLDDYALYRALHAENEGRYWREWSPGLRDRDPGTLADARQRLRRDISYYAWLQWIASEQWQAARRDCGRVGIFGDFPFMVSRDSADVWARQDEFLVDVSVGVPPDAFSATGQDWGLPGYRWNVMQRGGYEWLRQRARRSTELYDGFRVDHLVGFYRTYMKDVDGSTRFEPPDEASQIAQGERLLTIFKEAGHIIAEDLGTVPDPVRESLARLGVPGLKVMRWEREWDTDGHPFREPSSYPEISVATAGTHDTETLAEWWDCAPREERVLACELAALRGICNPDAPFSDLVRDALLRALFADARSSLRLAPIQDIFGWKDRINTPAVVDDVNWTWRLPWPVEDLAREPEATDRAGFLRALVLLDKTPAR